MKYFACLFVIVFCILILGCKKKTTTTAVATPIVVHYDTFAVHYWRLDSAKNAISDNRTQNFIFESNGTADTTFSEIRKFKSIGNTTITYFVVSKYTDGLFDLSPFFIYSKASKTSSTTYLETFMGKSYFSNGKTNQIENLTIQKIN